MAPEKLVKHDGLWWPIADRQCRGAIKQQIPDIANVMRWVDGREVCVQAGGNVGIWPLELANHFDRVLTFEPEQDNFNCLSRNTLGVWNIDIYNALLSDKPGFAGLHIVPENAGAHWMVPEGRIPALTIDGRNLPACDLIYLDIEGAELKALFGAEKTIERCYPVIAIEDKGLSRKFGILQGAAEQWLAARFGYEVVERIHRDVVLRRPND